MNNAHNDMGAAYSMSNNAASTLLLVLVSANMISLVSLAGEASSVYLEHSSSPDRPSTGAYAIRLQMMRLLLGVLSVAAGIKLSLNTKLADDLIAAWFVGQGFALQDIIRNIISGIVARYSPRVQCILRSKVTYGDEDYVVTSVNIASITLRGTHNEENNRYAYFRVLPWTAINEMKLHA